MCASQERETVIAMVSILKHVPFFANYFIKAINIKKEVSRCNLLPEFLTRFSIKYFEVFYVVGWIRTKCEFNPIKIFELDKKFFIFSAKSLERGWMTEDTIGITAKTRCENSLPMAK